MTPIAILDTETTGTDPGRHHVWEVAVIMRGHRDPSRDGEWRWLIRPDLTTADPTALRIGHYYERGGSQRLVTAPLDDSGEPRTGRAFEDATMWVAQEIARLLAEATLVAANPAFDSAFLDRFLRASGQAPSWNYRMLDIGSLTAGKLGRVVGGLTDCADALGVAYDRADLHSALADARLAAACFDAVIGGAA